MKNLYKDYWVVIIFIFIPISSLTAQNLANNSKPHSYWEVNLNGGFTQFFGDLWNGRYLSTSYGNSNFQYAKGLSFGRQFSPIFGLRTQAVMGELAGERETFGARFKTDYIEFNLSAAINISNLINRNNVNKRINFYLIAGPALTNYKTTKYELNTDDIIAQKGFGDGSGLNGREMEFSVMGGFGLNIKLGDHWGINLESANRLMLTDQIDLTDNNRKSDIYNYTSLGLQFRFGNNRNKANRVQDEIKLAEVNNQVIKNNQLNEQVVDSVNIQKKITNDKEIKREETILQKENLIKQGDLKENVSNEKPQAEVKVYKTPDPEYRVQIRACLKCQISREKLGSMYNLDPTMIMENKNGDYYIYTVGSYSNYREAESTKIRLKQNNKISDAFIVAFSKGLRLSKLPE